MNKPGSILGGVLLIAGSCIGAGMLGLPIITGIAGFFPSLLMFFFAWVFMTLTGLLLVEAGGWFPHRVNMLSMVERCLGKGGKVICWVTYLFLFYALLVAYISGTGDLFSTFLQQAFSFKMPSWLGSLAFVLLFGSIIFHGTRKVDHWNRSLMTAKIVFFLCLIFIGVKYVHPKLLLRTEPSYALFSLPILITSFGFHNMVPSLTEYMHRDLKRVRITIILGSLFVLAVYLIWEVLVLGIVPISGGSGLLESYKKSREGAQVLSIFIRSPWVSLFAQGLAFFAMLTSFLAQALSLVHFLADGLKVEKRGKENIGLCALALLPPLVLSIIYPGLFFKALNFAGGFCAVILFGILPVIMVWLGRYRKEQLSSYAVPGGKMGLTLLFCFSAFIFLFQIFTMFGWVKFPA